MSDQTRDALKRLAQAMRKAAGLSEPAAEPASQSPPGAPAPQLPPDKRAQVNPSRIDETPRRAVP
jgi:hypothetical protein